MSKPLDTKVSTTLSENVQIGTKVSIFCVATIIFQQIARLHLLFEDAPQMLNRV